jgi:putative transcriptional regulator
MIEHTDEGALGVVLNRPHELEVGAVLHEWADLAAAPPVLYMGGPVEPERRAGRWAGAARTPRARTAAGLYVLGDVGTVDLHLGP